MSAPDKSSDDRATRIGREALAQLYERMESPHHAQKVRAGRRDKWISVKSAILAAQMAFDEAESGK